ncbi:MAG: hypothetical protein V3V01_00685 [Acidimicrobiales bacterium]
MASVMTVRGPVDVGELGITHLYEHLLSRAVPDASPGAGEKFIDQLMIHSPARVLAT